MLKTNENHLTNLDKVYWPKEGYTKGDLLTYYEKIAPFILPYLKNRAISMRRNPNGIDHPSFFQKDYQQPVPKFMKKASIEHSDGIVNYLTIQNLKSLLFVVNLGCIEINPLNSQLKKLDYPDYLIIDLDPEHVEFKHVIKAALVAHELLDRAKIPNYCKTSGGRGLHIYIPMGAKYTYEQVKHFAELIANLAHQQNPEYTSLVRSPSQRQGKVYYDFLQNNFGQTLACAYCLRPKPYAPVSTPLHWKEVKDGLAPEDFNIQTIFPRLEKYGDIFKPVLGKGINLQKALTQLEKQA